ncbi:DUF350 domain-containing protein [Bacillus sp. JCM 19041]|uniref:DUF350 domain-containing protein n=1 Tax=Bacillus sp. JCM 19041 TaxID=1460637 RepID=UPI0006CF6601
MIQDLFGINFTEFNLVELTAAFIYLVIFLAVGALCMFVFEKFTPYDDFAEFKKGNKAVAIQWRGKLVGIAIVMFTSVYHNSSITVAVIWGVIGFVLMMLGYWLFEKCTKSMNVEEEIKNGNEAVAIMAGSISIFIAIVTAAAIV